ncbi:DUF3679 domain-containing protein [Polycladomyces sp. WAk]|uniref:DUF3679 domain-containing protein n=1 Tax=Polycladomyces zharkentensis TaxID=2807616 RepID=A0ABS2WGA2_9BACL|nr:DUF3679 domain-containing protein [Polycladomyces sp. WAk]MBN2908562.1 DUF3679 domain-containing protein [Polycladomyces sp. WAk]
MRWAAQVTALLLVLMFGVFLGIDTAEQNIQKIQGNEGAPRAVHITPENGRVEISVMGHVVETENPVSEKNVQRVKQVKRSVEENSGILAKMGNEMGSGIREGARKAIEVIVGWLDSDGKNP